MQRYKLFLFLQKLFFNTPSSTQPFMNFITAIKSITLSPTIPISPIRHHESYFSYVTRLPSMPKAHHLPHIQQPFSILILTDHHFPIPAFVWPHSSNNTTLFKFSYVILHIALSNRKSIGNFFCCN